MGSENGKSRADLAELLPPPSPRDLAKRQEQLRKGLNDLRRELEELRQEFHEGLDAAVGRRLQEMGFDRLERLIDHAGRALQLIREKGLVTQDELNERIR